MELKDLKNEIPFKWRVQSANSYGASCVAFIDARDVQDKLDEVCSPENWQVKYGLVNGNLFASIGIYSEKLKEWVWKSDCGTESAVEKQKGEASDAFKRAAVMWGVGRFLYSKTIVKLPTKEKNKKFVPFCNGKFIYGAEDITNLCNEGYTEKKVKPVPPVKAVKSPLSEVNFTKAIAGTKTQIQNVLDSFELSQSQRTVLEGKLKTAK